MTTRVAWILVFAASIITACSYTIPKANETDGCGNGVPEQGEQCDDGNDIDRDACEPDCTIATCGNGIVTNGEECDDGNAKDGDGCTANCEISICGDGKKQPGEECDEENLDNSSTCDSNCTLPRCGNAITGPDEVCDDGNVDNGDACNSSCTLKNQTSIFIGTKGTPGHMDGVGEMAQLSDRPVMTISNGIMFISGANTVRRVDLSTRDVQTMAGMGGVVGSMDNMMGTLAQFASIDGLATNGETLWVADADNHILRTVGLKSPFEVKTVAGTVPAAGVNVISTDGVGAEAQFDDLRGLVFYNGLLYMLDCDASVVKTFEPMTGDVKTVAGIPYQPGLTDGPSTSAQFTSPRLMTSDGKGLLYIADYNGHIIRVFDTVNKTVSTLAGSSTCGELGGMGMDARLYQPRGITTDGANVYFTEPYSHTIRQVVVATKQVTTLSGTPLECATNCTCMFGVGGGYAEGVGKAAQWSIPWDIAFDPMSKSLFVSDSGNSVIRRIQ